MLKLEDLKKTRRSGSKATRSCELSALSPLETTSPMSSTSIPTTSPARKCFSVSKQFYGTIGFDPIKAKFDFANILDEVVQQFTAKLGVDVSISVEIQARSKNGFDESLQRTIKKNCNVLKFSNAEFEDE